MESPSATGMIEIDASPERVYEIVADMPGYKDWVGENEGGSWSQGATGAAVGVKFRGVNRGRAAWKTTSTITAADPGRHFAFDVTMGVMPIAQWEYLIEASDGGGCRVTESTRRKVPWIMTQLARPLTGVADRDAENQRNIERSLAALKSRAETNP